MLMGGYDWALNEKMERARVAAGHFTHGKENIYIFLIFFFSD
jgi:hypothetical protein